MKMRRASRGIQCALRCPHQEGRSPVGLYVPRVAISPRGFSDCATKVSVEGSGENARAKLQFMARADNGSVNILLPRSFLGIISTYPTSASVPSQIVPVELSPDLQSNATVIMDTDRKRFFIGHSTQLPNHSNYDKVEICIAGGSVKLGYDDDVDAEWLVQPKASIQRLQEWRRIFCC